MEENLELVAAEIELQNGLELERQRRKERLDEISRFAGTRLTYGDVIIGLTAVIFLLGSLCALVTSIFVLMDSKSVMLFISALLGSLCSLGVSLALFRVLALTVTEKDSTTTNKD